MQRRRLNFVLAGVVAALGITVYVTEQKKAAGPPLTPYKADAVTKIVIAHPKADVITLERHDKSWALTSPVKVEADPLEAAGLAALAEKETKEKLDTANLNLAELKLSPPEYTVKFNDTTVAFGGVEPLDYRRYVKVGDAVYLVDDPPGAALDADYADLVEKNLFPDKTVIEQIELPGLTVTRGPDGKWTATPADAKATPAALQKMSDGWLTARAMWNELAPKDKPPTGDTVKIVVKGGKVYSFVVAAKDPQFKLYHPDAGVNFVLSKALADELLKIPEPAAAAAPPANAPPGTLLPSDTPKSPTAPKK